MANELMINGANEVAGFGTAGGFNLIQRVAKLFNTSSMTPTQYQGEKNIGNCIIAVNMANRLGADPLMVMQNLNIIQGKPSWSSSFMIALFNGCGKFAPIRYRATGEPGTDTQGIVAYTYDKATGEIIEGEEVTIGLAKAEGWYGKSGSKWRTMPGQMLRYRAAAWLIRTTAPELTFGLYMQDEVIDVTPVEKPVEKPVESPKVQNEPKEHFVPARDRIPDIVTGYSEEPGTKEEEPGF